MTCPILRAVFLVCLQHKLLWIFNIGQRKIHKDVLVCHCQLYSGNEGFRTLHARAHHSDIRALFKGLFCLKCFCSRFCYNNIMYLTHYLLGCLLLIAPIYGQDERVFRELLLHQEKKEGPKSEDLLREAKFKVRSPRYYLDLVGDKKNESFYVSKLDGQDWVYLFNDDGKQVFKAKFDQHGPWSRLFKVQKRYLSEDTLVLVMHFYEGTNRYLETEGSARFYFLTIDKNNIEKASLFKGPAFWHEYRDRKNNYVRRKYEISLYDFDKDNIREISIRHKRMTRVYKYMGQGRWIRPNKSTSF